MHRNLVVRVSGFAAYSVGLSREVQDDVLRRHAHALR
jgi:pyruvate-formate lyase